MNDIVITLQSHWETIVIVCVITIPLIITGLFVGNVVDRNYNKNNIP